MKVGRLMKLFKLIKLVRLVKFHTCFTLLDDFSSAMTRSPSSRFYLRFILQFTVISHVVTCLKIICSRFDLDKENSYLSKYSDDL